MNDKIDINRLTSEISSNSDVREIKLFADNCCINYYTNIMTDIDYLNNFLHDERQTDNESIEYSMYVTQINPSMKNEFLNCINMNEDIIIHNHIVDYHYCYTTIDTQNNAVNIYYSSELIYFILEVGHTYIIMFDKCCDNKTSLPLYIVREIIYRQSENNDFICFHAAACELAKYGIMIIGNPGMGKTGLLMTLIEYQESSFISNDRILINESLLMFSLPMPVRISPASIVSSKVLNEYILENRNKLCRQTNIEDIILSRNGDGKPQKKIELSPLEVSNCFHKNYIDISKLRIVIIPEFINEGLGEIRITPIDVDDISQMLRSNCYTPDDPLWIEPWFFRKPINLDSVKRCIDTIANTVPTFKVQYGSDIQNVFKQKKSNWFIEKLM